MAHRHNIALLSWASSHQQFHGRRRARERPEPSARLYEVLLLGGEPQGQGENVHTPLEGPFADPTQGAGTDSAELGTLRRPHITNFESSQFFSSKYCRDL